MDIYGISWVSTSRQTRFGLVFLSFTAIFISINKLSILVFLLSIKLKISFAVNIFSKLLFLLKKLENNVDKCVFIMVNTSHA